MPRGRYEFTQTTRNRAIEKWREENPEADDDINLEVHHKVPVWWAKKNNIPSTLVRIQDNAVALSRDEHKEVHRNELSDDEYRTLAQSILGWVRNLI